MAIRRPNYQLLNAEYDVFENADEETVIGRAVVIDGIIDKLVVSEDVQEDYRGQILCTLVMNIIKEADRLNSNLSVRVIKEHSQRMKRFLERFGFRDVGAHVFKRVAGAIRPTAVTY